MLPLHTFFSVDTFLRPLRYVAFFWGVIISGYIQSYGRLPVAGLDLLSLDWSFYGTSRSRRCLIRKREKKKKKRKTPPTSTDVGCISEQTLRTARGRGVFAVIGACRADGGAVQTRTGVINRDIGIV